MHVLHEALGRLLKTLIGRACKSVTPSLSDFRTDNFLPLASVAIDDGTMDALKKASEKEVNVFVNAVRKHYEACCRHLLNKASVSPDSVSASFRCLSPSERRSERTICDIVRLAAQLPFQVSKDLLIDEWKLLQQEPVDDNEGEDGPKPIDLYWKQCFEMKHPGRGLRYPLVTKVVNSY